MNVKVTFKKTAGGEVAILKRADYERLAALANEAEEDAGTARLVVRARREIDEGRETVLPFAVVDRISKDENALRVVREWRGLTQKELETKSSTGQSTISALECGSRRGTIAAWRELAEALDVPMDILIQE